jgi:hypothetical protein
LALSVPRTLTSQPSLAIPLQFAKPAAQEPAAMVHAPAVQVCITTFGSAQARPQPPQCEALVSVFTSQPLLATPSQLPAPELQVTTVHAPAAQPVVLVPASAHTTPHPPQWAGSMVVFAQNVDGAVPQVARPPPQVVPHTPPEHT